MPAPLITVQMAMMDCIAMLVGMFFADIMGWLKSKIRFAAPVVFLLGYGCLVLWPLEGNELRILPYDFPNTNLMCTFA